MSRRYLFKISEKPLVQFGLQRKFKMLMVTTTILCTFALGVTHVAALEEISAGQILEEINLARTQPNYYSSFLREFLTRFQGSSYLIPGTNTFVKSIEGTAAVEEAINFLANQQPLPPLEWSPGLAGAASELVQEQRISGATGHDGGRFGGMEMRTKHQGIKERRLGEDIAYGLNSPRSMVMELIVDVGVPNRGHRKNMFSSDFIRAGVSCGSHPRYETMCVIDFSGGY